MLKLKIEKSEETGEWWIRCYSGNGKLVGTTQEGYKKRSHTARVVKGILEGKYKPETYVIDEVTDKGKPMYRWALIASNKQMVFGSHDNLKAKWWADEISARVASGEPVMVDA